MKTWWFPSWSSTGVKRALVSKQRAIDDAQEVYLYTLNSGLPTHPSVQSTSICSTIGYAGALCASDHSISTCLTHAAIASSVSSQLLKFGRVRDPDLESSETTPSSRESAEYLVHCAGPIPVPPRDRREKYCLVSWLILWEAEQTGSWRWP
jgi:hypothetical protein